MVPETVRANWGLQRPRERGTGEAQRDGRCERSGREPSLYCTEPAGATRAFPGAEGTRSLGTSRNPTQWVPKASPQDPAAT